MNIFIRICQVFMNGIFIQFEALKNGQKLCIHSKMRIFPRFLCIPTHNIAKANEDNDMSK